MVSSICTELPPASPPVFSRHQVYFRMSICTDSEYLQTNKHNCKNMKYEIHSPIIGMVSSICTELPPASPPVFSRHQVYFRMSICTDSEYLQTNKHNCKNMKYEIHSPIIGMVSSIYFSLF